MYKYCSQNATTLGLCCVDFRKTSLSETSVDPFCSCTITASMTAVYRSKYLKKTLLVSYLKICIVMVTNLFLNLQLNG